MLFPILQYSLLVSLFFCISLECLEFQLPAIEPISTIYIPNPVPQILEHRQLLKSRDINAFRYNWSFFQIIPDFVRFGLHSDFSYQLNARTLRYYIQSSNIVKDHSTKQYRFASKGEDWLLYLKTNIHGSAFRRLFAIWRY